MSDCKTATGIVLSPQSNGFINWPVMRGHKNAPQSNGMICADDFASITTFFNEQFTTPQTPPLAGSRTTEPGGQDVTITDTANNLSITGGYLLSGGTVSNSDPSYISDSNITAQAGLLFGAVVYFTPSNRGERFLCAGMGWGHDTFDARLNIYINNVVGTTNGISLTLPTNTNIPIVTVNLAEGGMFVVAKISGVWELGTPSLPTAIPADSPVDISRLANTNRALSLVVKDNPAITAYYFADSFTTSPSGGFTHPADFQMIIKFTRGSADTSIKFRIQDASNYWVLVIVAGGTTCRLDEVVSGVATTRGTSSNFSNDYIALRAKGNSVVIKSDQITKWQRRIAYNSASNFNTETSGEYIIGTGGTLEDSVIYPTDMSAFSDIWDSVTT